MRSKYLALEVAEYFRVDKAESKATIARAREVVSDWLAVATELGISRQDQNAMRPAFRAVEK